MLPAHIINHDTLNECLIPCGMTWNDVMKILILHGSEKSGYMHGIVISYAGPVDLLNSEHCQTQIQEPASGATSTCASAVYIIFIGCVHILYT